jgi:hypothetical protein
MTTIDEGFNLAQAAKVAERQNLCADAAEKYRASVCAFRAALATMASGRSYDLVLQQCEGLAAAADRMDQLAMPSLPLPPGAEAMPSLPLPPGADSSESESKGDLDALSERLARLKANEEAPPPSFEQRLQALKDKDGTTEDGMCERLAKLNPESFAVKAFQRQHNTLDIVTPGGGSGDPSLDLMHAVTDEVQTLRGMGGPGGVGIMGASIDDSDDDDAAVANLIAQAQDSVLLETRYGGTSVGEDSDSKKEEDNSDGDDDSSDSDSNSDSDSDSDDSDMGRRKGRGKGKKGKKGKKGEKGEKGRARAGRSGLGAGSSVLMAEADSLLAEARGVKAAGEGEHMGAGDGSKHTHGKGGDESGLTQEVELDAAAVAAVVAEAAAEAKAEQAAGGVPAVAASPPAPAAAAPAAAALAAAPAVATVTTATPPPEYQCPITGELLADPVVCADGHTYERLAIAAWIQRHPPPDTRSPMTNEPMHSIEMFSNISLRKLVQDYARAHGETLGDGAQ